MKKYKFIIGFLAFLFILVFNLNIGFDIKSNDITKKALIFKAFAESECPCKCPVDQIDDEVLKDLPCNNNQCNGIQIRCEDATGKCCDATKAKACSKCG